MEMENKRSTYVSWLLGEIVLIGLLAGAVGVFASNPAIPRTYALPETRLLLNMTIGLAAALVAVLTGVRFSIEGRRFELFLCAGFGVTAVSEIFFSVAPVLGGQPLHRTEAWAGTAVSLLGALLIAIAPFSRGRARSRFRAYGFVVLLLASPALVWLACRGLGDNLPPLRDAARGEQPYLLTTALSSHALLSLIALVGFGLRYRTDREDLDRWLALGATILLFAKLSQLFTPLLSGRYVSQGDFLGVLSYIVLLVGVWRAMRFAEFGRAVADERARVAREIHDGLAQYLFALSTHASRLESGADPAKIVPRLKEAALAAQQEARFAVLALSSASGNAPFDAALRRYVEFLTADGELDVDLEIDEGVRLGPDEQIEVFRIVQEGLANVRKHSSSNHAEVTIGERSGARHLTVRDYGSGFEVPEGGAGQGLRNIRTRVASIGARFDLVSTPGEGTALEVVLRTG
jgi:signal transduction histidine kinase